MLLQLVIGALLLVMTVAFQALSFDYIIKKTHDLVRAEIKAVSRFRKAMILAVVTLGVSFVLVMEVWLWGWFYLIIETVPDWETALYFSASSFTTVGFGDVYLDKDWRLLSSIEAMNGFLMFGWSTAFIFEIVSHVYRKEGKAINDK